jgi:lysophospholipase L1-like esterase
VSRAGRARRIAAAAAFGGGGLGALGAAAYGVLFTEVRIARRVIGQPFGSHGPGGDGVYGAGPGAPIVLAMLGDSTSVGLGTDDPSESPGVVLAQGLAAIAGRPVRLVNAGAVGARSEALDEQSRRLLEETTPDVAVIMVGANDVTHRTPLREAVRHLDTAVRRLREAGTEVVVGTCPDLGTIEPIPHPLRYIARRSSRELAAAQIIAVVEAGGRTVSLGDLLGPEFYAKPKEMFSSDRFHPSGAGYARAAAAMLPSVATGLGYWPAERDRRPDVRAGEGIDDIAHAAVRAADTAGTEVAGAEISGSERGPRGRWAMMLRRRSAVPRTTTPRGDDGSPPAGPTPIAVGDVDHKPVGAGGGASGGTVATTTPD